MEVEYIAQLMSWIASGCMGVPHTVGRQCMVVVVVQLQEAEYTTAVKQLLSVITLLCLISQSISLLQRRFHSSPL